jgi:flagellar hook-length control protein FliK
MYTYVQLPLRLQQGEAHGDLYVYANKKNLAAKDGPISALLHLDMEHLGPVDVYVSMNDAKVNTKFYLQDDEMLDFIMGHMDILTERLQKRGYNCTFEMQVRNQEEEEQSSIQKLLQQENHIPLAEYAFDIRA